MKTASVKLIQERIISRISYVSLYILHDRVTLLEEKYLGAAGLYNQDLYIYSEESLTDSLEEDTSTLRQEIEQLKQ